MGKELVSDELWKVIEPLLPSEMPKPNGGRPRVPDRAALTGIISSSKAASRGRCSLRRWLRLGEHLLAAPARLGRIWGVAQVAPGAPRQACRSRRSAGPGPRSTRRVWRLKGAKPSTKSDGSRKTGFEAPPCGGWGRGPAHGSPHHRECTRLEGVRGSGGRHRADQEAEGRPRKRPEKLHVDKS
jgi:hypothetical protein